MGEMEDRLVNDLVAHQAARVRCDGCGAEWQDLDAATHSDGYSDVGCPNRCGRLTTPVYWPSPDESARWIRVDPEDAR